MKTVIIANPVAGGGRIYRALCRYIQEWPHPDWDVELRETQGPEHAGQMAAELLAFPPDLLCICGGDGTVNEVACRISHPPFPVALIPAGTANVVARELRIPFNPVHAIETALKRAVRPVDLGELNGGARRFVFVAGIGFDAYCVANVNIRLKKKIGMAAYAAAIASCLRSYSFPEFQVAAAGRTYAATSCLACNSRNYGGGLLFCPQSDMSDGRLDILVIEGKRRLALAWFLLRAFLGIAGTHEWVHRFQARNLRVEGGPDLLVEADGELAGTLPLEITVLDKAFPLVSAP